MKRILMSTNKTKRPFKRKVQMTLTLSSQICSHRVSKHRHSI